MPQMNILNAVEREALDSPPVFNSFQRKQYFDFPSTPIRRWPPQSGLAEACKPFAEVRRDQAYRQPGGVSRRGGHGSRLPGSTSTCSASMTSRTRSLRDRIGIRPPKLVD